MSVLVRRSHSKVQEAIHFQYGIMVAQYHNAYRVPTSQYGDMHTYSATATDKNGRQRVVQDAISIRVLQTLLIISLVLLTMSWIILPKTNVLPGKPTTIASAASLLAGGNVLDILSADPEWQVGENITKAFASDIMFWLGWETDGEAGKTKVRRFGAFVTVVTGSHDHRP